MPEINALPAPSRALDGSELVVMFQDLYARQTPLSGILTYMLNTVSPIAASAAASATASAGSAAAAAATATAIAQRLGSSSAAQSFAPEQSGNAAGDGVTNDNQAFATMTTALAAAGGGVIRYRPNATYLVGAESALAGVAGGSWAYAPKELFYVQNLGGSLIIDGQGATVSCASGLKYGSFDPVTGFPATSASSNDHRATPYTGMISAVYCTGPISIKNIILHGHIESQTIGGQWGGGGIQIAMCGVFLYLNKAPVILENVQSLNHGQDGMQIGSANDNANSYPATIINCNFSGNMRQGVSVLAGNDVHFIGCKFNNTGRYGTNTSSSPGAGCDVEPNSGTYVRNVIFDDCEFINNIGVGLVASASDVSNVIVRGSRIVGTTAPSVWPNKPNFVIQDSLIVGGMGLIFPGYDASDQGAFRSVRNVITDDPSLSPTGLVYLGASFLMNTGVGANYAYWNDTDFIATGPVMGAIFSAGGHRYNNCRITSLGSNQSVPRGEFTGTTYLTGNVNTADCSFRGPVWYRPNIPTPVNTYVQLGLVACNPANGNIYQVTTAGITGAASSPTGNGSGIVDGAAIWAFVSTGGNTVFARFFYYQGPWTPGAVPAASAAGPGTVSVTVPCVGAVVGDRYGATLATALAGLALSVEIVAGSSAKVTLTNFTNASILPAAGANLTVSAI